MSEKTLAVIPARGGSQELKRKNLLPDADGIPLVLASARAARDAGCTVVVSTDDPEIASLAKIDGHHVHSRGPELADVPVDEVVQSAFDYRQTGEPPHDGPVLLVQPTVQPITAGILHSFLADAEQQKGNPVPVALGVEDRHLIWTNDIDDKYMLLTDRVERQAQLPWPIREMGVRWWPAGAFPSRDQPQAVIAAPHHLVDIDTAADYQQIRRRLRIGFMIRANKQVGSGHLRRALTLAEGLQHHDVTIDATADTDQWTINLLSERQWGVAADDEWDVLVYDQLDLYPDQPPRGVPTVGLEVTQAGYTATVNAMYDVPVAGGGVSSYDIYMGSKYAVLRSEFLIGDYTVNPDTSRVMVMFGGTDPSGLGVLTESALSAMTEIHLDVYPPGVDVSIAAAMHDADLLITSGGRTVFEAAAVGIPTIVMCQNQRELTHTHLGVGNINLGLGRFVQPDQLRWHVEQLLGDYEVRRDMSATAKASIDGYGADRVRRIIEHVGLYGEAP